MPLFAEVLKTPNGAYVVDYPDGSEDHCIDEYTAEEFAVRLALLEGGKRLSNQSIQAIEQRAMQKFMVALKREGLSPDDVREMQR